MPPNRLDLVKLMLSIHRRNFVLKGFVFQDSGWSSPCFLSGIRIIQHQSIKAKHDQLGSRGGFQCQVIKQRITLNYSDFDGRRLVGWWPISHVLPTKIGLTSWANLLLTYFVMISSSCENSPRGVPPSVCNCVLTQVLSLGISTPSLVWS